MTRERHPWNRRHLLAGGGATALISAAARADAKPIRGKPSRNIVLVHGAFADGSCWSEVIVRLRAKGYNVSAVQCPLTSLADDVKATRRVLDRQTGPVILVGHSWGGTVITEAGEAPNVEGLVYVSALAPDAGEAVVDLQKHGPASDGMKGARPDGDGFLWFDHEAYAHGMAADVPAARVGVLAAVQKPIAAAAFGEKLTAAAWRHKPSWFVTSEHDRALAPQLQRWMVARMQAKAVSVPSSHMSLISHADTVTSLIETAAREA